MLLQRVGAMLLQRVGAVLLQRVGDERVVVVVRKVGLQIQCGVNFFILDSTRVLAPAPKVLGPKHISNPDLLASHLEKGGAVLVFEIDGPD